jgi:hypothetical protein
MPKKGDIALCSLGTLGMITADEKEEVSYPDGGSAMAWTGVHLERHEEYDIAPGDPWSSRDPKVVGSMLEEMGGLRHMRGLN